MKRRQLISIAIPCYKSSKTIPIVVDEIVDVFKDNKRYDYEIILSNDGSPDETFSTIRNLCKKNGKIIGIDLSRNFSQANARMSMINYISGDIAVFMDDDGQHKAKDIIRLIDKVNEGNDVVCAHLIDKKCSKFKIITSDIYNRIMVLFGVYPKNVKISSFFAINRYAIDQLKHYKSPSPSVFSYLLKITTRFANVEVIQNPRISGKSGYTLKKLVSLAIMNLTNFSIVPLRFATVFGTAISIIGAIYMIILIVRKIINPSVLLGYTSIMSVILFLIGVVLVMLGLLGEYVGRIYMTLSNMPQFTIRETINYNKENNKK